MNFLVAQSAGGACLREEWRKGGKGGRGRRISRINPQGSRPRTLVAERQTHTHTQEKKLAQEKLAKAHQQLIQTLVEELNAGHVSLDKSKKLVAGIFYICYICTHTYTHACIHTYTHAYMLNAGHVSLEMSKKLVAGILYIYTIYTSYIHTCIHAECRACVSRDEQEARCWYHICTYIYSLLV
jgi:hypothetical protein